MQEGLGRIVETYIEHSEFQEWLLRPGAFLTRSIVALAAADPHDVATIWALMREGLGRLPGPGQLSPTIVHKEGLGRPDDGLHHLMAPVLSLAPTELQREYEEDVRWSLPKFSPGYLDNRWSRIVDREWRPVLYTGREMWGGTVFRAWARWAGYDAVAEWYRNLFVGRFPSEFQNPYAPWVELGARYGIQLRSYTDGESTVHVDWNIPAQVASRHVYALFLGAG